MPVGTFYTPKHQRRKKPRSLVRISENWFRSFWREGSKSFPSERLKSPVEVRLPGVFLSTDNPSNQPNAKGNKAAFTRLRSPRPFSHTLSPLLLSPSLPCASPLLTPSLLSWPRRPSRTHPRFANPKSPADRRPDKTPRFLMCSRMTYTLAGDVGERI